MPASPKVSALLQALIDKGLFDRLPPTFSTFFYDQIKEWELLFPAERGYHERLFGLIDRSGLERMEALFQPLRAVEIKMGVNEKNWPKRQFTLDQVDFLNRSPHYAEWRKAVSDIFGKLDPVLDQELARSGRPRLVIVTAPAGLPVAPDRMWLRIRKHGKAVPLEPGGFDLAFSRSAPYDTWRIRADGPPERDAGPVVSLNYETLKPYRMRLMSEVRRIVESEDIRGPRQLGARLKQLKMREGEGDLDPILAEFKRAVLLNGNGTLLINNTFVEWATVQAVRRARPSLEVSFGIRNKLKLFSSVPIF